MGEASEALAGTVLLCEPARSGAQPSPGEGAQMAALRRGGWPRRSSYHLEPRSLEAPIPLLVGTELLNLVCVEGGAALSPEGWEQPTEMTLEASGGRVGGQMEGLGLTVRRETKL